MKFFSIIYFIGFLVLGCASSPKNSYPHQNGIAINDQLVFREVAANTFVVTDQYFHNSNVLVAAIADGTVVIASSPFETIGARDMIAWIKMKLNPKRIIAINTHFHADGTGGNDAYAQAGAEIWASHETKNLHMQKGIAMKESIAADFANPDLKKRILSRVDVPANNLFQQSRGHEFNFGGENIRVIYPGPAHSSDNVVVFLPKRGVLFGGCMVKSLRAENLGYTGHANVKQWPASARKILDLSPHIVIPGHGSPGGPELIEHTIQLAQDRI